VREEVAVSYFDLWVFMFVFVMMFVVIVEWVTDIFEFVYIG